MRNRNNVSEFIQTLNDDNDDEKQRLLDTPAPVAKGTKKTIILTLAVMWVGVIIAAIYIGTFKSNAWPTTRELLMGAFVNDTAVFQGGRIFVFASGCSNTSTMHFLEPGRHHVSKPASLTSFCTSFKPCSPSKGCDWQLSAYLDIPVNATPGVWTAYYDIHGKTNGDAGTKRYVNFAVLAKHPTNSTIQVVPVYTYQAYNFFGFYSFYLSPHIDGKTFEREEDFLHAITPETELQYVKRREHRTTLSLNRPYIRKEMYPEVGETGKVAPIKWKTTWDTFTGMVIPESHLLTHKDWLCEHFNEIQITRKNEYVDTQEVLALLGCSSGVTLIINSFEYAFHHVQHSNNSLIFTGESWNDGAWRIDRDVFGGSNLFTGHKDVLFCLQHQYGNCMFVRAIGPVDEGLPDYTIPTGHNRMTVLANQHHKYKNAPKNSKLRYSFTRANSDATWEFVGVEFDKDTHKMTHIPAVASFMTNTVNGEVNIGAVCPGNVCTQGVTCNCTGFAPAQSFFDGRATNQTSFYYWP